MIADSTPKCSRRAAAKVGSASRSRSAADSLSFFGRAFRFSSSSSFSRFAPVETAGPQVGERLPAALEQWNCDVGVAARPRDLVAEREPVPVLDDADRNAELNLLAGLALGDLPGVLLEDREHFHPLRGRLPLKHAAVDLVREASRTYQFPTHDSVIIPRALMVQFRCIRGTKIVHAIRNLRIPMSGCRFDHWNPALRPRIRGLSGSAELSATRQQAAKGRNAESSVSY